MSDNLKMTWDLINTSNRDIILNYLFKAHQQ
jgi:hypothetical protein